MVWQLMYSVAIIQMIGNITCRKHNIYKDSHPNSTKPRNGNTINVNTCVVSKTQKTRRNKHSLRERWEYCLGTVSDKCHWGV